MLWLTSIGIVAILLFVVVAYNRLVRLRNETRNAWHQIDVQLERRHDLVPNLVEAVRGAMGFERETLEAVIGARNRAAALTGTGPGKAASTARAEQELSSALTRFLALAEAYPELRSVTNVAQLQEELASTENKIGFSRQLYNDLATQYNVAQEQFPTNLIRGLAGAHRVELWEIVDPDERTVPRVDLSLPPAR